MPKFEVKIKGKVVWSGEFDNGSARNFPAKYLERPESGEVHLVIDGELVGVQKPISPEAAAAIVAQRREEVGDV